MARQLRLRLGRPASHSRDEFVTGPSNTEAVAALDAWPAWPGGTLALVGPEGGWTGGEIQAFKNAGFVAVKLTTTILRVETAAIAIAALIGSSQP